MTTAIRSESSRSVLTINGVDLLAVNQDGSLELLAPAANPSGNKIPTAGQLPFTKEYVSAPQTYTLGGALSLLHGFGVAPKLITLELVCTASQAGYSAGDVVPVSFHGGGDGGSSSASAYIGVWRDATSIGVRFGTYGLQITNKTTGAQVTVIPGNFNVVVRAYA